MILPDFVLPSRINQRWIYSGIDSPEKCFNKKHFKNYPYQITYEYNSRGFRDAEWPESINDLKECIWCFGDSFTVGIGSPIEHTWVNILENETGRRCINVSMDGASNRWIYRKVQNVINIIDPKNIIIHYSYLHRRELNNTFLSDEERRLHFDINDISFQDNFDEFSDIFMPLKDKKQIIHSFIPGFFSPTKQDLELSWNNIKDESWGEIEITQEWYNGLDDIFKIELEKKFSPDKTFLGSVIAFYEMIKNSIMLDRIDIARDGHHYDILTTRNFVSQIIPKLI